MYDPTRAISNWWSNRLSTQCSWLSWILILFSKQHSVLPVLESNYGPTPKSSYYLGCINPQIVVAGWAGGIGRGMVEGPFEMVKVRRQIVSTWTFQELFQGFGTTMFRNSILFSSFVMYMDIFKQQVRETKSRQHLIALHVGAQIMTVGKIRRNRNTFHHSWNMRKPCLDNCLAKRCS